MGIAEQWVAAADDDECVAKEAYAGGEVVIGAEIFKGGGGDYELGIGRGYQGFICVVRVNGFAGASVDYIDAKTDFLL